MKQWVHFSLPHATNGKQKRTHLGQEVGRNVIAVVGLDVLAKHTVALVGQRARPVDFYLTNYRWV